MTKLSFDDLAALLDPIYDAALSDREEISRRCRPVDEAHARPSVRKLAADPALRASWFGSGDTHALRAWQEALAPFIAEDEARRLRLCADIDAAMTASGWTDDELTVELARRCGF